MDEVEYEYYETTPEVDQDPGAPPRGTGWELLEVVAVGKLRVHRWRRVSAAARAKAAFQDWDAKEVRQELEPWPSSRRS